MRSHIIMLSALVLLTAIRPASGNMDAVEHMRIKEIKPAIFDYTLMSYTEVPNKGPRLAFNHRMGRTFFVYIGGKLGEHTVSSFESKHSRYYDEKTKTHRVRKKAAATLKDPDGETITLELKVPLQQPGWCATLVSLKNGQTWTVKKNDSFKAAFAPVKVNHIEKSSVVLAYNSNQHYHLRHITPAEQNNLNSKIAKKQKRLENSLARQKQVNTDLDEESLKALQQAVVNSQGNASAGYFGMTPEMQIPSSTTIFYGTEYLGMPGYSYYGHPVRGNRPVYFHGGYGNYPSMRHSPSCACCSGGRNRHRSRGSHGYIQYQYPFQTRSSGIGITVSKQIGPYIKGF